MQTKSGTRSLYVKVKMISKLKLNIKESLPTGEIFFYHGKKEIFGSAFELGGIYKIIAKIPLEIGAYNAEINIFCESGEKLFEFSGEWVSREEKFDLYCFFLNTKMLGRGLYFAEITVQSASHQRIFTTKKNNKLLFYRERQISRFQLSVSDFKYEAPKQLYGGIIYHIFVDRFKKSKFSNENNKNNFLLDWCDKIPEYPKYPGEKIKNNYFFGGDLFGIAEKLDYLLSLGINLIYLSPIFESPSNHKYDTSNYMKTDEGFGGDSALIYLISEAKKRGIDIILDGVFNHTGDDSIYFNKYGKYASLGAYQSKESKYFSWYEFKKYPEKYTSWWDIDILPRINPDKEECREYFVGKGGVIEKYLKMGIIGFRLDVVDELSDEFVEKIKEKQNEINNKSVLFGEVWEDASNKIAYETRKSYYLGSELDGVMNYPLRRGIIDYLRNKETSTLGYYFEEVMPKAPKRIRDCLMNLLGSHDTERILTALGGEEKAGKNGDELLSYSMTKEEYSNAVRYLKTAYALIATLPGIPSVYYGDEAGMEGYSDPFNRQPYPWGKENKELLKFYRLIGKIRRNSSVFRDGEIKILYFSSKYLIFERYKVYNKMVTVINNTQDNLLLKFNRPVRAKIGNYSSNCIQILPNSAEIIDAKKAKNIKILNIKDF